MSTAGDELVSKEVSPDAEQESSLLSLQNEVRRLAVPMQPYPPTAASSPGLSCWVYTPPRLPACSTAAPHHVHARTGVAAAEPYPYP